MTTEEAKIIGAKAAPARKGSAGKEALETTINSLLDVGRDRMDAVYTTMKGLGDEGLAQLTEARQSTLDDVSRVHGALLDMTKANIANGLSAFRQILGTRDIGNVLRLQLAYAQEATVIAVAHAETLGKLSMEIAEARSKTIASRLRRAAQAVPGARA